MSWSLAIEHGDLVTGNGGLATVTGGSKLVQDLSCAVLEHAGTDPLHPTFGSTLDGGTDLDGNTRPGMIGDVNDDTTGVVIEAEVRRICRAYQSQQIARNQADVAVYGRSTLTADEALLDIDNILLHRDMDKVLVTATLRTGLGSQPLAVPING